ncbi:MAG: hypothetical protein A3J37_08355 [Alphaproteobacteria bacterium RIFCSPHIGHO2_12_FULL_45_9]|nr:MAG: hypothetical protein A3B66_03570 [Alphaproteobacteria bacterium RIFCSPHIGHO2_02_FULL_46_13]OFW95181.1 MAG: hypothetical protein A3J37_08355 [Alphaproteobacteria bacterium RIFCSPHIGHO2_12_FULL_45_9]
MKKLLATACIIGSTLALTACDTTGSGYVDTQPPYAQERTVGSAPVAPAPVKSAEPVFEKKVTK